MLELICTDAASQGGGEGLRAHWALAPATESYAALADPRLAGLDCCLTLATVQALRATRLA